MVDPNQMTSNGVRRLTRSATAQTSAQTRESHHETNHPAQQAARRRRWPGQRSHIFFQLEFSNIGQSSCTFFGYPGVSAVDIHGHQVGQPVSHSGTRLTVTLAPGATAHVVLEVTQAGFICAHPVKAAVLKVFPPGQRHAQLVDFPSEGCPGRSVLHVDALHPRAGIPGFTSS